MSRCGTPWRRRCPQSAIPDGHQLAAAPISDGVHALGPRGDLDIENPLILGDHPPGPLQQDPQLGVGVSRPDMGQNRALTTMFTHHLHRHRARGRAHLPHIRHGPNLPA